MTTNAQTNNVIDVTPRHINKPPTPLKVLFWAWFLFWLRASLLEGAPIALHTLLYMENVNIGGDAWLSDLPFIGWLLPDLPASSILALILACASVLMPYILWKAWLDRPPNFDMRSFFRSPLNVVGLVVVMALYFAILAIEVTNFHLYIVREPILEVSFSIEEQSIMEKYALLTALLLGAIVSAFGYLTAKDYLATTEKLRRV